MKCLNALIAPWRYYDMRTLCITFLVMLLTLGIAVRASAESDQDRINLLRTQIQELENQAKQYRSNIATERVKGESLKREIAILKNQIKNLETKIQLTDKKIDKTKLEIEGIRGRIFDTQQQIGQRQGAIGRIILFLSQQDQESLVTTLVKNDTLSDFFRQAQYAANLDVQLLQLVEELKGAKADLEDNQQAVEGKQQELEQLNQEQRTQRISLGLGKTGKDQLLAETKGQEAAYTNRLKEVEQQEADFFAELLKLERTAIAGGQFLIHVKAASIPPKGTRLFRLPEDDAVITQSYGMTRYARRGAYGGAPHNGVDFAGGYGSIIKAIGDGQVIAGGLNDGWGNWVAVRHVNDMVSVYSHMSLPSTLAVGTMIKMSDIIGYEGATGKVTGPHVHLSLYRDFFTYVSDKNGQLYFNYFEGSVNPMDYL